MKKIIVTGCNGKLGLSLIHISWPEADLCIVFYCVVARWNQYWKPDDFKIVL